MSAADYPYDGSGNLAGNFVQGEVQALSGSLTVYPKAEAFYNNNKLKIMGKLPDGTEKQLYPMKDFVFSPPFDRVTKVANYEAFSYFTLLDPDHTYTQVSWDYSAVGQYVHSELIAIVNDFITDRMDITQWVSVMSRFDYSGLLGQALPARETLTERLIKEIAGIREALSKLDTPTVLDVEDRLTAMEDAIGKVPTDVQKVEFSTDITDTDKDKAATPFVLAALNERVKTLESSSGGGASVSATDVTAVFPGYIAKGELSGERVVKQSTFTKIQLWVSTQADADIQVQVLKNGTAVETFTLVANTTSVELNITAPGLSLGFSDILAFKVLTDNNVGKDLSVRILV